MDRKFLWFLVALLIFGDFITTWYGVSFLGFQEQNSFMAVVINNHAWSLFALIKIFEFTFVYAIVSFMDKKFKDKPTNIFKTFFIAFALIILIATLVGNIGCLLGLC